MAFNYSSCEFLRFALVKMKLWQSVECLSSTKDHKGNEGGKSMTPGPERIHRQPWGPLREVRLEPGWESSSTWGSAFLSDPGWSAVGSPGWVWMGPFKPEGQNSGELWGCQWSGACEVDPGFSKTAGLKEGGDLGQVLTGLAGVSSRTCRLPAPQTDTEAATAWSSSGELSTVWSFLLELSQCLNSYRVGERYNVEVMGNTGNYLRFKGTKEVNFYRCHPSGLQIVYYNTFPANLKRRERLMVVVG